MNHEIRKLIIMKLENKNHHDFLGAELKSVSQLACPQSLFTTHATVQRSQLSKAIGCEMTCASVIGRG